MDFSELYSLSRHYLEIKYQAYHRQALLSKVFQQRLSIVLGQRGVGKTTLIIQYLRAAVAQDILSPKILYVPVDHFLMSGCALYEIAEQFQQLGGAIIAFDEIHKYPAWSQELKSITDTFPDLQVIASGSSALAIHQGSHDLTRRAIVQEIFGFSFREYLELTLGFNLPSYTLAQVLKDHEAISRKICNELALHQQKILLKFKHYLQTGYYPYALELQNPALYWMTLEQNIHTTIDSDLSAIFPALTGSSTRKLKQLLGFIAAHVPFVPQFKKLKQIFQIGDERTLKNYLKYLEDARLIRQLKSASSKFSQLEIPEKIYLDNPNQLYAIANSAQNIGTIRELFFLDMVAAQHDVTAPKQGDFLVDQTLLFEVGGKNKKPPQRPDQQQIFLACDDIESGLGNKIPLWLFGFIY